MNWFYYLTVGSPHGFTNTYLVSSVRDLKASMMFIMPIPQPTRDTAAMAATVMVIRLRTLLVASNVLLLVQHAEIFSLPMEQWSSYW